MIKQRQERLTKIKQETAEIVTTYATKCKNANALAAMIEELSGDAVHRLKAEFGTFAETEKDLKACAVLTPEWLA